MKLGPIEVNLGPYIEKELIGKRFLIALLIIGLYVYGGIGEGVLGAVVGYYFGSHITQPVEVVV